VRSLQNYTGRMVIAPLALVMVLFTARPIRNRPAAPGPAEGSQPLLVVYMIDPWVIAFSFAWMLVFLAPVLPIVSRSELYLYLPVFGVCLLAGLAADALVWRVAAHRVVRIALTVYVTALVSYQAWRALAIHRDLVFSQKLVVALRGSDELRGREGRVVLLPADDMTERFLQDSIGGYLHIVLPHALGTRKLTGAIQYRGQPPPSGDLHFRCQYDRDEVTLKRM